MSTGIEWTEHTKVCRSCTHDLPLSAFAKDSSRSDGHTYVCSTCRNRRARENHTPKPKVTRCGRTFVAPRDGDVKQARRRANHLVAVGVIPAPNSLPCTDCDHKWSEGERRHEYDHHLGYAAEHHEDVEPVCTTCHHAREALRRAA